MGIPDLWRRLDVVTVLELKPDPCDRSFYEPVAGGRYLIISSGAVCVECFRSCPDSRQCPDIETSLDDCLR